GRGRGWRSGRHNSAAPAAVKRSITSARVSLATRDFMTVSVLVSRFSGVSTQDTATKKFGQQRICTPTRPCGPGRAPPKSSSWALLLAGVGPWPGKPPTGVPRRHRDFLLWPSWLSRFVRWLRRVSHGNDPENIRFCPPCAGSPDRLRFRVQWRNEP